MPQLFFSSKYVWFPVHLKGHVIPDPSGQLAELIAHITSTRVDLYSHQILLHPSLGFQVYVDRVLFLNDSTIVIPCA